MAATKESISGRRQQHISHRDYLAPPNTTYPASTSHLFIHAGGKTSQYRTMKNLTAHFVIPVLLCIVTVNAVLSSTISQSSVHLASGDVIESRDPLLKDDDAVKSPVITHISVSTIVGSESRVSVRNHGDINKKSLNQSHDFNLPQSLGSTRPNEDSGSELKSVENYTENRYGESSIRYVVSNARSLDSSSNHSLVDRGHQTASFLDPCSARRFLGDIALTDEDLESLGLNKQELEDDRMVLQKVGARPEVPLSHRKAIWPERNERTDVARSPRGRRTGVSARAGRSEGSRSSRSRRAATARRERLWKDGVIPYDIDANFSGQHKALFKQAMRHWENNTCITFVERTPQDYDYIIFTERPCGCCSFVGKRGSGAQAISIGKNCDKFGIVVHELGHVVGFWHEHTRPDRNDYVKIMYENIMTGQDSNFVTVAPNEVNSLGEPYDFQSIMHYARNTFSRSSYLDSIVPLRAPVGVDEQLRPEIGQRIRLSKGDIAQANKLYNCPRCGRTMQDSSATFGTDDLRSVWDERSVYHHGQPFPSRNPVFCQWRISATHGEKIVFNFIMINIPDLAASAGTGKNDCRENYVEIRDGHYGKSPLIGKFCGSTPLPSTIVSTDSRLWIEYRSALHTSKHHGFTAKYEAVCGGELLRESGTISSPNYPDYYKPNKDCVWRIIVPDGFTIALMFQSFEVENHDNCVYDYVEIRDGDIEASPQLHKLCGYRIPADVHSSTNKLYIRFVSDGSVQKEGFSASFVKEFDECKTSNHGCEHICVNTLGGYRCECKIGYELNPDGRRCDDTCGGYLDASNGTIQSPLFPDLYPPNKNCIWLIEAPAQHRITITFEHFDIEGNNQDCEYDSVELRSGPDAQAKTYGTFCGNQIPQSITSDSNTLRVTFSSDNTVQKSGFVAHFFTDKDECSVGNGGCQHICKNTVGSYQCSCHNGFTLYANKHDCKEGGCQYAIAAPQGEISSPNWPDNYPNRKDCMWYFSATAGHRIKLVFNEFELEAHLDCTYDWIQLFDGPDDLTSQSLGVFCGSKLPQPIITSGHNMFMTFKTDASVQRRGFHAVHSTVCGGNLLAVDSPNTFYSHAKYGDQNYENREDCEWLIYSGDDNYSIRLRFQALEIEEEIDCGYDFVEIFDGIGKNWTSVGRFCGNKIPPEIISSSSRLLIHFQTDDTIFWKGFSAEYMRSPRREGQTNRINTRGGQPQGNRQFNGLGNQQPPAVVTPSRGRRWENQHGRHDRRYSVGNMRREHQRRHARHHGQYRSMT